MQKNILIENKTSFKRAAVMLLRADLTLEKEWAPFIPKEMILQKTRIPSSPQINSKALLDLKKKIKIGSSSLRNIHEMEVIAFACTSARAQISFELLAKEIRVHHPNSIITDPVTGLLKALKTMNIRNLGLISPYIPEVLNTLIDALATENIIISESISFNEAEEIKVASISEKTTMEAIIKIGLNKTCEAVFVSCTNLPSFSILNRAEQIIGKPVLSSNLVLLWHLFHLTFKNDANVMDNLPETMLNKSKPLQN